MKRLIAGAPLALLFSSAMAQTTPAPVPPCYPNDVKGTSFFKLNFWSRTPNGWYLFWYCKNSKNEWDAYGIQCRHGDGTANDTRQCDQALWSQAQIALGLATDKSAEMDRQYRAMVTDKSCKQELADKDKNMAICNDMYASMAANRPAAPAPPPVPPPAPPPVPPPAPPPVGVLVVSRTSICGAADKENGVCALRQGYAWDSMLNVRGGLQPERARFGAQCVTAIGTAGYYAAPDSVTGAVRNDRVYPCSKP